VSILRGPFSRGPGGPPPQDPGLPILGQPGKPLEDCTPDQIATALQGVLGPNNVTGAIMLCNTVMGALLLSAINELEDRGISRINVAQKPDEPPPPAGDGGNPTT
jgi:hypothetical protein